MSGSRGCKLTRREDENGKDLPAVSAWERRLPCWETTRVLSLEVFYVCVLRFESIVLASEVVLNSCLVNV